MLTGGENTLTAQDIISALRKRGVEPGTVEFKQAVDENYIPVYEDPTGEHPTVYTEKT